MRDQGVDVNPPQVADQPLAARAASSQASHVRRRSAWTSRTIGSKLGNQIVRGLLGSIFGGKR